MGRRLTCGAPESSSTSCSAVSRHSGQVRFHSSCIQVFSDKVAGLELLEESVTV
jgi:hypothetical protein